MDFAREVPAAARRIAPWVRRTPVEPSPVLGAGRCRVHLKLENQQRTGSFKLRGAMNKLAGLPPAQRDRGVVAASTGNHGAGVACGAAALSCKAVIFAPHTAAHSKLRGIADHGAEIRFEGEDCVEAEAAARVFAAEVGGTYISPYNDLAVVAGQGTVGLELHEQLDAVDAVIVAVGGGGLISGVGGYLRAVRPGIEVIGASPLNSCVMHASLQAGTLLDLPSEPTLSDGTAGGVEPGSITFDLCREVVDHFVLVSEDEIRDAMRLVVERHHTLIEGSAAVAVAAFLSQAERYDGRDVAVVLCGANIDPAVLATVLAG